jgi:hypothetical protein
LYASTASTAPSGFDKTYSGVIGLEFRHRLTKLTLNIGTPDPALGILPGDLAAMTVQVNGLKTTAPFDLSAGTLGTPANTASFNLRPVTAGSVYDAIILPDAINANTVTVEFNAGNDVYTWEMPAITFVSGLEYVYTVTFTASGGVGVSVSVTGTIVPWTLEPDQGMSNTATPSFSESGITFRKIVYNTAELLQAMQEAQGGDTIGCAPGDYEPLTAHNIQKPSLVVVMAANRNHPPRFTVENSMMLSQLTNFSFEGFFLDGSGVMDNDGYPTGRAIRYGNLTNVTFRNFTFDFWHAAITHFSNNTPYPNGVSKNVTFEFCRIKRRGMDWFRNFSTHEGLTFRRNYFTDDYINTERSGEAERHPDIIQFATSTSAYGYKNVLIEENKCVMIDHYSHCFFLRSEVVEKQTAPDGDYEKYYLRDITVRNNDLIAPHVNTISFGGAKNVLVHGNRIRSAPPNLWSHSAATPSISFYKLCDGEVYNNALPTGRLTSFETGALDNINQHDNFFSTETALPVGWRNIDNLVGPYAYENE